jgi:hemerythrin-like metal-binding protein
MEYLQWDEKFSIKNDKIDSQHKKLIGMINDVQRAMTSGSSRKDISKIFNNMVEYTKEHFSYEEDLFTRYSYGNGIKHKIAHSNFIIKTLELYGDFVNDRGIDLNGLLDFLVDWLQKHILIDDMKFGEFLQAKDLN